jgi:hypothetical protein
MDIKVKIKAAASGSTSKEIDPPFSIEVKEQLKQAATFTITYADDICDGDFKMIQQDIFNPFNQIEIWVVMDGKEYCLIKGLVQSQQIKLVHGGKGSQVKVTGTDNSMRLGWVTETKNWKKKIEAADIITMLTTVQKTEKDKPVTNHQFDQYIIMGKTYKGNSAANTGTGGASMSFGKEQIQKSDDLSFIKQLAAQKGMYFWISYGEKGEEIVHFEKLPLKEYDAIEADKITTLSINRVDSDLENFSVSWDANRPTSVESGRIDPKKGEKTENELPKATQPKLGKITLASMTGYLMKVFQSNTSMDEADQKERNEAALNEAEWFIKASCSSSYDKLCKKNIKPIHAHTMIAIDGAGSKHSGAYLVSSVTHTITEGEYNISLELIRNAWNGPLKKSSDTLKLPGNAGLS